MFLFPCFNLSDADDPSLGLTNGQLAIPGYILRREVFDPVMEEVWGQAQMRHQLRLKLKFIGLESH